MYIGLELLDIRDLDGVPGLDDTTVVDCTVKGDTEFACLSILYVLELTDVSAVLHNFQHTADKFGGGLDHALALSVEGCIFDDAHGVVEWIALHL